MILNTPLWVPESGANVWYTKKVTSFVWGTWNAKQWIELTWLAYSWGAVERENNNSKHIQADSCSASYMYMKDCCCCCCCCILVYFALKIWLSSVSKIEMTIIFTEIISYKWPKVTYTRQQCLNFTPLLIMKPKRWIHYAKAYDLIMIQLSHYGVKYSSSEKFFALFAPEFPLGRIVYRRIVWRNHKKWPVGLSHNIRIKVWDLQFFFLNCSISSIEKVSKFFLQ